LFDCILCDTKKFFGVSGTTAVDRRVEWREADLQNTKLYCGGHYLLVDAIFMTLAKPVSNWIGKHLPLKKLRD
jgi:hypothetical protein